MPRLAIWAFALTLLALYLWNRSRAKSAAVARGVAQPIAPDAQGRALPAGLGTSTKEQAGGTAAGNRAEKLDGNQPPAQEVWEPANVQADEAGNVSVGYDW